jgi:regulator of sigma E protease
MATILIFLLILIVLVLVHEAGHALAARLAGCRVEEFGIGFPPRLAAKKVGETLYSFNSVPLGGFVRITGEDDAALDDPRSFSRKPRLVRIGILLAGVAMNAVLAVVLFSIIAGVGSPVPIDAAAGQLPLTNRRIEIVDVSATPVLQAADVRSGDALVAVGGAPVADAAAAVSVIRGFSGTELPLRLRREGEVRETTLHFSEPHVPGVPVGLALLDIGTYQVSWWRAPAEGVRATARTVAVTAEGLQRLVLDLVRSGAVPKDVAGPVGIASLVGTVSRQGFLPLMELTAVLSVNLALLNALPIPALDGGRVLFVIVELFGIRRLRGRPERLAHAIGFAVLLALMALITIRDIHRLFS